MKKIVYAIAAGALLLVASCTDLDPIYDRLDTLESSVKTLKENAEKQVTVSKVEQTADGYKITFSNGTTATLKDGAKGDQGPQGEKGDKGDQGPQGEKGEDGDAYFKSFEIVDNTVVIVLNDEAETTIVLPIYTVEVNSVTFVPDYADGYIHVEYADLETAASSVNYVVYPAAAAEKLAEGLAAGTYKASLVGNSVSTKALTGTSIELAAESISVNAGVLTVALPVKSVVGVAANSYALLLENTVSDHQVISSFNTLVSEKIECVLGGVTYKIAKMKDGNWWMAENLRYIPVGKEVSAANFSTNTGIWYPATLTFNGTTATAAADDSEAGIAAKGLLYSEAVAMGGATLPTVDWTNAENTQGICPDGWHIPTAQEWVDLVGACSATARQNLNAPYYNSTTKGAPMVDLDADGFNCSPSAPVNGGTKYMTTFNNVANNAYYHLPSMAYFASSTGRSATQSYAAMVTNNASFQRVTVGYNNLTNGVSVRCVKD